MLSRLSARGGRSFWAIAIVLSMLVGMLPTLAFGGTRGKVGVLEAVDYPNNIPGSAISIPTTITATFTGIADTYDVFDVTGDPGDTFVVVATPSTTSAAICDVGLLLFGDAETDVTNAGGALATKNDASTGVPEVLQYEVPAGDSSNQTFHLAVQNNVGSYGGSPFATSAYWLSVFLIPGAGGGVTTPTVSFEPDYMEFDATQGGQPPSSIPLTITIGGDFPTVNWYFVSLPSWLSIEPTGGVAPGTSTFTVGIDMDNLPEPGEYYDDIGVFVDAPSGPMGSSLLKGLGVPPSCCYEVVEPSPTATMPVYLAVYPDGPANLGAEISESDITFDAGSNPSNELLTVGFLDTGAHAWTATETASWLSLSKYSGTGDDTAVVSFSTASLPAGDYSTTITVSSPDSGSPPVRVGVRLHATKRNSQIGMFAISDTTLYWGQKPRISGVLGTMSQPLGMQVSDPWAENKKLRIEYAYSSSGPWSRLATVTTGSSGSFSYSPTLTRKTYFRAIFPGDGFLTSSAYTTVLTANTQAKLTIPSAPSAVYKNRTFGVSGFLSPSHTVGAYSVKLYFYHYERVGSSNRWVVRKTKSLPNLAYNSSSSKYLTTTYLPYAGYWRIKAYHSDSNHLATWSPYKAIRVY